MFCCLFGSNLTTIVICLTALVGIYLYLRRKFDYWSSRGIKGPKPVVLIGNLGDAFFKPSDEIEEERLQKYGNIYGFFMGSTPTIAVAEPEIIKNIMIKDFHIFVNRNNIKFDDPILDRALSLVQDNEWKKLRSVISPTFSSGKIRKMHQLVEQCVKSVDKILADSAKDGKEVELKTLMGNYTMDVIARCAFATKTDTYDPNNPFVKNAIKIFRGNPWRGLLFFVCRPLMKMLNISIIDPEVANFFKSSINEIMSQRRAGEVKHHDFLQLMINAQKQVSEEEPEDISVDAELHHGLEEKVELISNKTRIQLTDDDIIANSLIFFLGGYETTASLLSYLFYSLAINPECQEKLLEEVLEKRDENGKIDYESIVRMPYLDACVSETLRLYNPAPQTSRTPSEDYKLGDTGLTIPKGMMIIILIHAIHHNPDFYPNPHRFDPDRFLPENKDKLIPYTYLPFGAGPRNCVGMRFALMEAKTIIANIITKYKFVRTENTKIPLQFRKFVGFMQPTDITVGVEVRK